MTLAALRDDALTTTEDGFALLLALPWIRSLPLASLTDLAVTIAGEAVAVSVDIGGRVIPPQDLHHESSWWFLQDRVRLVGDAPASTAQQHVTVAFRLVVPYLATGPDGPLALPFRFSADLTPMNPTLTVDAGASRIVTGASA